MDKRLGGPEYLVWSRTKSRALGRRKPAGVWWVSRILRPKGRLAMKIKKTMKAKIVIARKGNTLGSFLVTGSWGQQYAAALLGSYRGGGGTDDGQCALIQDRLIAKVRVKAKKGIKYSVLFGLDGRIYLPHSQSRYFFWYLSWGAYISTLINPIPRSLEPLPQASLDEKAQMAET